MKAFKDKYSQEYRTTECTRIMLKYPDRIPVIVELVKGSKLNLDKNKFLVPNDLTVGQFMYVIRTRIHVDPDEAIFLFVNNTIPTKL